MPWTASILTNTGRKLASSGLPKTAGKRQVLGAMLANAGVPKAALSYWIGNNIDIYTRLDWTDEPLPVDHAPTTATPGDTLAQARLKRAKAQGNVYGDWPAMLPRSSNGVYEGVTQDQARDISVTLMAKYPGLRLDVRARGNDGFAIEVYRLQVKTPGAGVGSLAMKDLQVWAAAHAVAVVLTPEANPRKKQALDRFYRRHGFRPNRGRHQDPRLSSPFASTWIWTPPGAVDEATMKNGNGARYAVRASYVGSGHPYTVYIKPGAWLAPGEWVSTPSMSTYLAKDNVLNYTDATALASAASAIYPILNVEVVPTTSFSEDERAWLGEAVLRGGQSYFAVAFKWPKTGIDKDVYASRVNDKLMYCFAPSANGYKMTNTEADKTLSLLKSAARSSDITDARVIPWDEVAHLAIIGEANLLPKELWHGTCSGDLRGGTTGLHLGTREAAKQALEARIGIPAEGEWDGTRKYGETLLMGTRRMTMLKRSITGQNCGAPDDDYYPSERRVGARHSDGSDVSLACKPDIFKVKVTGPMANQRKLHADFPANRRMARLIGRGPVNTGFVYRNDGEDPGSASVVVPNGGFVVRESATAPWDAIYVDREAVIKAYPPKYSNVSADHVTLAYPSTGEGIGNRSKVVAYGYADDGGVECLAVTVDGRKLRPDGKLYHVTISVADGREAKEAGDVAKSAGVIPALELKAEPAKVVTEAVIKNGREQHYYVMTVPEHAPHARHYATGDGGGGWYTTNVECAGRYNKEEAEAIRDRWDSYGNKVTLLPCAPAVYEAVLKGGHRSVLKPVSYEDLTKQLSDAGYTLSTRDFVTAVGDLNGKTYCVGTNRALDYDDGCSVYLFRYTPGASYPLNTSVLFNGTKDECIEWLSRYNPTVSEAVMKCGQPRYFAVCINTDVGWATGDDGRDAPADSAHDAWIYPEGEANSVLQRVRKWGDSAELVPYAEWQQRLDEAVLLNGRSGFLKPIPVEDLLRRLSGCGYELEARDIRAAAGDLDGKAYFVSTDECSDDDIEDPCAVYSLIFTPGSNADPLTGSGGLTHGTEEECIEWLQKRRIT